MGADRPRTRRDLLRVSGLAVPGVLGAGCTGFSRTTDDIPTITPAPVPTSTPPPTNSPLPANTVLVGPEERFAFEPAVLEIEAGTTVRWVWDSDIHNIAVGEQPAEADWDGAEPIRDEGFTYEHTFSVAGRYEYWCEPHKSLGAEGSVIVR